MRCVICLLGRVCIYILKYIFLKNPFFVTLLSNLNLSETIFWASLVEQPSSCFCHHFHEFLFVRYICILDFSMNNLFINSNKIDEIIPNNE